MKNPCRENNRRQRSCFTGGQGEQDQKITGFIRIFELVGGFVGTGRTIVHTSRFLFLFTYLANSRIDLAYTDQPCDFIPLRAREEI